MQIENKVYILDTSPLKDEKLFSSWYVRMYPERKKKIDAFKVESGKRMCLGAGILLHKAFNDIGISDFEIEIGEHEKPKLKGIDGVFFNISHSGDMAVLGISDMEIGVDIEENQHFKDNLIRYVFSKNEILLAGETAGDEMTFDEVFTRFWTIKESIMKHSGLGISLEPKKIEIYSDEGRLKVRSSGYNCDELNLNFHPIDGYQITVCSGYKDFIYCNTILYDTIE